MIVNKYMIERPNVEVLDVKQTRNKNTLVVFGKRERNSYIIWQQAIDDTDILNEIEHTEFKAAYDDYAARA